jgi:hypothetical protein
MTSVDRRAIWQRVSTRGQVTRQARRKTMKMSVVLSCLASFWQWRLKSHLPPRNLCTFLPVRRASSKKRGANAAPTYQRAFTFANLDSIASGTPSTACAGKTRGAHEIFTKQVKTVVGYLPRDCHNLLQKPIDQRGCRCCRDRRVVIAHDGFTRHTTLGTVRLTVREQAHVGHIRLTSWSEARTCATAG